MSAFAAAWIVALLMQGVSSSTGVLDIHVRATVAADVLPRREASELRSQVGTEITVRPSPRLVMRFDGVADALLADRGGRVSDGAVLVRDAYVEAHAAAVDVRAGYGRLVWGRLDEIAPTDVINPLDAARFLFDGRSEARLPVTFVRARVSASEHLRVEGVLVPRFRRGVFDRLDESSSPFNLVADAVLPAGIAVASDRVQVEPAGGWRSVSGGARVETTLGRVDASASVYRGFDALGPIGFQAAIDPVSAQIVGQLVEFHPRFTMVGGDFETVSGPWAVRGEVAAFVERSFASAPTATPDGRLSLVDGRSFDAGAGVDRRVGAWRVSGSTVVHREWADDAPSISRTDVDIVGSMERAFRGDRYLARGFLVVNPADAAAFVRGLWTWKIRDNVTFDVSVGAFMGSSRDTIGRFSTRDFVLTRARYDF
jgi:hypothetical protein